MRLVRSPSSATPTIHTPPLRFARLRNPVTGFELDFTHDFRNQTDQQPPQAARENVTDFGSPKFKNCSSQPATASPASANKGESCLESGSVLESLVVVETGVESPRGGSGCLVNTEQLATEREGGSRAERDRARPPRDTIS